METLILHTTRAILNPKTLDEVRTMHNAFVTQGPQPGIEIARLLGDISHNVYTKAVGTGSLLAASPGELLFIDYWADSEASQNEASMSISMYCSRVTRLASSSFNWLLSRDGDIVTFFAIALMYCALVVSCKRLRT